MKAPAAWMREFAELPADPHAIAVRLAACGFEVASVDADTIDFEITANRPDCLSVYGLAREAAAAFDVDLAPMPGDAAKTPSGAPPMPVSVADAGCGRYALATAEVRVAPSPSWLAARLLAAGVRPINNVVDVTNYVMLECGHPMHAFDVARLSGPEIRVRRARPAERLTTLDGQDRALDETMLVIADRERAVAIAGVMGGAASEVSSATSQIAIESAWFLPSAVRLASRRLGLKTEASARFERGADISAPVRALRRALALLEQISAGKQTGNIADVYPRPAEPRKVALRRSRVARLLGQTIPDREIERILSRLGFGLSGSADGWMVEVPLFRVDVAREADLVEEVGRHWGFDNLPSTFPALATVPRPNAQSIDRDRVLRRVLCGAGLQEAATFTFIEQAAAAPFAPPDAPAVPIANPLSEKFAVLRPSILAGLLDAVVYNRHRQIETVRLFEIGSAFGPSGEQARVAWMLTGARGDHWSEPSAPLDLFDAKGIAELIGQAFGVALKTEASGDAAWLTPGRAAALAIVGAPAPVRVGVVGELRAEIASARGLAGTDRIVCGEIDLAALTAASPAGMTIAALPRYPSIVRDLSIVVDERLPAADLRGTIRAHAARTLVEVREFDRYRGKGIPDGQVSLSIRLTFRDADRTLTDHDVQQAVDAIVQALERTHGARLRGI